MSKRKLIFYLALKKLQGAAFLAFLFFSNGLVAQVDYSALTEAKYHFLADFQNLANYTYDANGKPNGLKVYSPLQVQYTTDGTPKAVIGTGVTSSLVDTSTGGKVFKLSQTAATGTLIAYNPALTTSYNTWINDLDPITIIAGRFPTSGFTNYMMFNGASGFFSIGSTAGFNRIRIPHRDVTY